MSTCTRIHAASATKHPSGSAIRIATLVALSWLGSSEASAQDVLIVHASGYISDPQSKLIATGRYTSVDLHDAGASTPTLATLQAYDAVMLVSDGSYLDATGLGNNVADYADSGGGVVVCTFSFHAPGGGLTLAGRISTDNYLPFIGSGQGSNTGGILAVQPGHDILAGVVSFSNGSSGYMNTVTLAPGADRVAYFSDGVTELVATMETNGTRVAGLNFYPPSSDIRNDFWSSTTDGDLLMANAIDWTLNAVPCPYGDADYDGVCDTDDICPGFDDRADIDGDGVPDGCDLCTGDDLSGDTDADGVCDDLDSCTGDDSSGDTDGDGVCDDLDACPGGNDAADEDGDGQPNACDPCPLDNPDDTDGDGICDSDDICPDGGDFADTDEDGTADGCDPCPLDAADDSDGDGVCDSDDRCAGFPDSNDADADGTPDMCDGCPNDPSSVSTCGDASTEDPLLTDERASLSGCLCQSATSPPTWMPLLLLPLVLRRRRTGAARAA